MLSAIYLSFWFLFESPLFPFPHSHIANIVFIFENKSFFTTFFKIFFYFSIYNGLSRKIIFYKN